MDFATEGKEYGLKGPVCTKAGDDEDRTAFADQGGGQGWQLYRPSKTEAGDASTSRANADFDTSGTVTLVSASFNGEDVTRKTCNHRDWVLFVYRPGNLTDGDHKLEIEVMDNAGNEGEFTLEFAKTERKPYTLLNSTPVPTWYPSPATPRTATSTRSSAARATRTSPGF